MHRFADAARKANPGISLGLRIKEWDYYLINNGRFALALTIDDNGYMGLDSISLLNFEEGWEITTSPMCFMPLGKRGLPETSAVGDTVANGKNYSICFKNDGSGTRILTARMEKFGPAGALNATVELTGEPEDGCPSCLSVCWAAPSAGVLVVAPQSTPIISPMGTKPPHTMNSDMNVPSRTTPKAKRLSRAPPERNELIKPGPTCKPRIYTKRIRPKLSA